jgi:molybdenum cofactor guanylyltransferase
MPDSTPAHSAAPPAAQVTGVILAGGLGRRMGGVDKGLQQLDGQSLVRHVAARLGPQVGHLLINANRNQYEYAALGYPVIGDLIPDFAGPLAGLHATLSVATTPLVVTAPCDSPYLPADLVSRLLQALLACDARLAVATADGHLHPVFCLCQTTLLPALTHYLESGGRRLAQWCGEMGAVEVNFSDQTYAFSNFNTLADLTST